MTPEDKELVEYLSEKLNVANEQIAIHEHTIERLRAERDELLAALTTIYHSANGAHPTEFGLCVASIEGISRAAIAKVKGGA